MNIQRIHVVLFHTCFYVEICLCQDGKLSQCYGRAFLGSRLLEGMTVVRLWHSAYHDKVSMMHLLRRSNRSGEPLKIHEGRFEVWDSLGSTIHGYSSSLVSNVWSERAQKQPVHAEVRLGGETTGVPLYGCMRVDGKKQDFRSPDHALLGPGGEMATFLFIVLQVEVATSVWVDQVMALQLLSACQKVWLSGWASV